MRYPSVSKARCDDLMGRWCQGESIELAPHVSWIGEGDEVDLAAVRHLAADLEEQLEPDAGQEARENLEALAAPRLLESLMYIDIEVLDDPAFWRYLGLDLFWTFIRWREDAAYRNGPIGFARYVDGERATEAVLTRMCLRARAVGGPRFAEYTAMLPRATDFWRSHIVRVKTGTAAPVVRAFVDMQRESRLSTAPLRQFAKVLNRTWSNVVPAVYESEASSSLIAELRKAHE